MTEGRVSQDIPFAMVPRWVIQAMGLDRSALAVYAGLAAYASDVRRAFPSIRQLARDLNCAPMTVQRALKRLEASGAVVVTRRPKGKGRVSNLYHLPFDPMAAVRRQALGAVDIPVDKSGGVCSPLAQGVLKTSTELDN